VEPTTDLNGVPFPGTMWAVWDEQGVLARHCKFDVRMKAHEVIEAFGYLSSDYAPYTIAEFTEDRWAELTHAIGTGADTSKATWAEV
jgi:hypothetical protein